VEWIHYGLYDLFNVGSRYHVRCEGIPVALEIPSISRISSSVCTLLNKFLARKEKRAGMELKKADHHKSR
jgi:hypothetical protein